MNNQDIVSQLKELTKVMTGAEEVPGDTVTDVIKFAKDNYQAGGGGTKSSTLELTDIETTNDDVLSLVGFEIGTDLDFATLFNVISLQSNYVGYAMCNENKNGDGSYNMFKAMNVFGNMQCLYQEQYTSGGEMLTGVLHFNGAKARFYPSADGTTDYEGAIVFHQMFGTLAKVSF